MFEFKLPDLGEGIHEGQVVQVLVKAGETIAEYQPMIEIETDKAAVEIPSPKSGVVAKVLVEAGQVVKVGQVLVAIDDAAAPASADIPVSRKVAAQVPVVRNVAAGASPAVGSAVVSPPGEPSAVAAQAPSARAPQPPAPARVPVSRTGPAPAAPVVRKLARELSIDIDLVPGSGPGGRILKEDVEAFARGGAPATAGPVDGPRAALATTRPGLPAEELPDFSQYGPIRRESVPQIRKTIARQMARAWANVPRVTHCDIADVTELERNRKRYNEGLKEGQSKLTMTAIALKAVAAALRAFHNINASYDANREEIIYKEYVHIGLAVDTPRGLVVPVIRDVDKKSLPQLAAELASLSERTRKGQFEIAELRGATFTITNVGALGGVFVTPMVNYPEVGILGLGQARLQPAVYEGQIVPRLLLPLSLSFDHRIVDGADAARFTREVITVLENPLRLIGLA
jgi:pyruvate dehydrogenase E2 component (dihydrolipoamide acetyltransferase)